jgi:hypothetical protein
MPEPDEILPFNIRAALEQVAERVNSDKTVDNAHGILQRGNSYEMRILIDLQADGAARVVMTARERLKGWTIYVAKNLEPEES